MCLGICVRGGDLRKSRVGQSPLTFPSTLVQAHEQVAGSKGDCADEAGLLRSNPVEDDADGQGGDVVDDDGDGEGEVELEGRTSSDWGIAWVSVSGFRETARAHLEILPDAGPSRLPGQLCIVLRVAELGVDALLDEDGLEGGKALWGRW